ncbi:hypothetical protein OH76DRAFT_277170 [Lentinus brumalis]|uniref:Uncharacterized protein n=1 Tax=Lentinus brumalis TaxID=2498619 RepID=A0A371CKZ1_9APHY|nr:hypothetical protein OH76DRAFT_277170 [Polyporus brumalis]
MISLVVLQTSSPNCATLKFDRSERKVDKMGMSFFSGRKMCPNDTADRRMDGGEVIEAKYLLHMLKHSAELPVLQARLNGSRDRLDRRCNEQVCPRQNDRADGPARRPRSIGHHSKLRPVIRTVRVSRKHRTIQGISLPAIVIGSGAGALSVHRDWTTPGSDDNAEQDKWKRVAHFRLGWRERRGWVSIPQGKPPRILQWATPGRSSSPN